MSLNVVNLTYKHKLNKQFLLGPINFSGSNYMSITGGNGSGKTTLLKCIAGLLKKSSGLVTLNNKKVGQVSWVGAEAAIYWDTLTAREYIFLTSGLYGADLSLLKKKLFKLELDYLDQIVFSLSTGQKKIVSILAAILSGASLVVLDEPDSNLDYKNKKFLYNLIKDVRDQFILFSSHSDLISELDKKNTIRLSNGSLC